MSEKAIVYLDTKFWIILRDVQLNNVSCAKKIKLYNTIIELNESRKIIIPISHYVLNEFVKQKDKDTLKECFDLILQLSGNISIRDYHERIFEELILFITLIKNGELNTKLDVISQYVWTPIPYTFGKFVCSDGDDVSYDEIVQDAIFECKTIDSKFLSMILDKSESMSDYPDPTCMINAKRKDKYGSSAKNQCSEFYLALKKGLIANALKEVMGSYNEENVNQIFIMLNNLKYKNKLGNFLPTLNTYSTLLSTWLVEQQSNIKVNHYFDIHHASAALPYFDVFLTEKSLKDAIQRVSPKYLSFNKCKVGSTPEEAIEILNSIK
ncbi:hypothetical protein LOC50_16440 [Pseudoalteromonas sp. SCSIO 43095]|uniref:hypothetical protein n=1 Tax=Pseudoalteromonas sp. SCSIO 43095 TaxID=2894202 RepID=UPI00202B17D1|nr:hypothetical protein [Pseudoalteromonas sp. SCSIO 43095]MDX1727924.1 hypothetical protein [Pseudoalteromonas tetraodonis]URR00254.1 hypothetical protein LOC50_16440 [Pseudoalteromonas sp. SCSIO 43095]